MAKKSKKLLHLCYALGICQFPLRNLLVLILGIFKHGRSSVFIFLVWVCWYFWGCLLQDVPQLSVEFVINDVELRSRGTVVRNPFLQRHMRNTSLMTVTFLIEFSVRNNEVMRVIIAEKEI